MGVRRGTLLFTVLFFILPLEYCNAYACSQVFTTQSGIIQSPTDAHHNYPNNANCSYTIKVGSNVHYICFKFEQFGLEKNYDKLNVGGQMFTGSMPGYTPTYNVDKTIVLLFTTDGSVNSAGGFRIRYRVIPDASSEVFTSGVIQSPKDAHQNYPNNANRTYTIRVGSNVHYIHFKFEQFGLENIHDKLFVGGLMFTGSMPGYTNTYNVDKNIVLHFTTDGSVNSAGGFRIRYRVIPDVNVKVFRGKTGIIENPKALNSAYYPDNALYLNVIRSFVGDIGSIQIIFENFDLERNRDFLYVGHRAFTGRQTGSKVYDDFNNEKKLVFTTDGSGHTYSGFRINYRITPHCMDGMYGLSCTHRCGIGCSDVCHKATGRCNCKVGWTGATCDAECPSGTYDSYCSKTCSPGCVDGSCNKEDGSCSCRPGYTGKWCKHECNDGYYGVNCTSQCSAGCLDACNKESGTCTCKAGWTGKQCQAACPSGTYDSYCTKSCSSGCVNGSCTEQNGSCPEKQPDFPIEHGELNMKLVVSVAGGLVGLITLLAAAFIICYCIRRKRSRNKDTKRPTTWKEIALSAASNETATSGEEALYDLPIERYETLRYSSDQRSDTSQSVFHVSGDVENGTEYVNLPRQKKNVKIERNKRKQCYENHAIHSTDSEM